MCQTKKDLGIIEVGENTNKAKYEFLRSFYTLWNFITKTSPRAIIDTHAGSGIVNLRKKKDILNKRQEKIIYGSALLAILKTLKISNDLKIILNEKTPETYETLKSHVNDFIENGVPVFIKEVEKFKYKSLETNRKRKLKTNNVEIKYPETPNTTCPRGFKEERLKTKAEVILYNKDIKKIMDEILEDHLEITEEKEDSIKPIALFFVDPCGSVSWNNVILKICERSQNRQGTGMVLNWSWEAIARNLKTDAKDSVLSEMYGIPIKKIPHKFKEVHEMDEYLEKYLDQLGQYFKYVELQGVPRDRKLKPKLSKYRKYFLILCTNNKSALSIAGHKKKKIQRDLRNNFIDISKFT